MRTTRIDTTHDGVYVHFNGQMMFIDENKIPEAIEELRTSQTLTKKPYHFAIPKDEVTQVIKELEDAFPPLP